MIKEYSSDVDQFWSAFTGSEFPNEETIPIGYQAWGFGNTPEMADALGHLVSVGDKTATASLFWLYENEHEKLPTIGEYSVILDGEGSPICIIKTTFVEVVPFILVSDEHAFLEGEGDRTLPYWRETHWQFFQEECAKIGRLPREEMPVVCERFLLTYRVDDMMIEMISGI